MFIGLVNYCSQITQRRLKTQNFFVFFFTLLQLLVYYVRLIGKRSETNRLIIQTRINISHQNNEE